MPNGMLPPFVTEFNKQLYQFLQQRPGVPLESLEHATAEKEYPLDKERKNELIHDRSGDRIFITSATGIGYIRANKITSPKYKLRVGAISLPFQKLFLSNAAQPGKKVSIIIGYEAFIDFASAHYVMKMLNVADGEVNPATEDKQDTLLTQLDLKSSQLKTALRHTKISSETDKSVAAVTTYEFFAYTGLTQIVDCFILSPSTSFSVIITVQGVEQLNHTYTEYLAISPQVKNIAAYPGRDIDGELTGKYAVCFKNFHSNTHVSLKVRNNLGGGPIVFDNLFCEYEII